MSKRMINRAGIVAAASAVAALAAIGGANPASATTPHGVTSNTLSQTTIHGKDYVFRRIVIQPGGSTGWHYHDEDLNGYIARGALTHENSRCRVDGIYRKGQRIHEDGGRRNVHIGRNLGKTPVVLYVVQIDPAGGPLAIDQPNPGCAFE